MEVSPAVAPKSLLRNDIGLMPQAIYESRGAAYVPAIPNNDSALIPKA
jgi:hypothetical protein